MSGHGTPVPADGPVNGAGQRECVRCRRFASAAAMHAIL